MCFAGEGGGKGRLNMRKGVELTLEEFAGEFLKRLGKGLGLKNGNFEEDLVVAWCELGDGSGSGSGRTSLSLGKIGFSLPPSVFLCEVSMGFP